MISKKKIEKFKKQGQYPRKTKNWLRYRQEEPEKFSEFRMKKLSVLRQIVLGKLKKNGKWEIQSILKKSIIKNKQKNKITSPTPKGAVSILSLTL